MELTASHCYTTNTNKNDYTTNRERETDRQTDRQTDREIESVDNKKPDTENNRWLRQRTLSAEVSASQKKKWPT